jgi:predicted MFS family arabinose efflux permease
VIGFFQSIQMLCPLLIIALFMTGTLKVWEVIALSLIVGITDALSMPSFQSIVPSLVEHEQIPAGLALNATQFNLSRILGPALAGMLIASVGLVACFAANALSYVPFLLVALWILPKRHTATTSIHPSFQHIISGVSEVAREPYLRGALLGVIITSALCGPLVVFSPVLVKEALRGDATHFSMAVGSFGIGGLIGATSLLFVDASRDSRHLILFFAVMLGSAVALTALNSSFIGLSILLMLAGTSMGICNISANSLLQSAASSQLRGLTVSMFMLAMRGGLSIGGLITGVVVTFIGVRHALLINGCLAAIFSLLVTRRWLRVPLPAA